MSALTQIFGLHYLRESLDQQRRELMESITRDSVLTSGLLDSRDLVGKAPLADLRQSLVDHALAVAQRAITFSDTASSLRDALAGIQPRLSALVEASSGQLRSSAADASRGSSLAALRDHHASSLALRDPEHAAWPSSRLDRANPGHQPVDVARRSEHPQAAAASISVAGGKESAQSDWVEALGQAWTLIEQFLGLVPTLVMAPNLAPAQIVDSLQPRGGLEGRAWSLAMAFCQLWRKVHALPVAGRHIDALDEEAFRALAFADAIEFFRRSLSRYLDE
jgi:hypothetical protein